MKAIRALALLGVGAVLMSNLPLRAAEAESAGPLSPPKRLPYKPDVKYDAAKTDGDSAAPAKGQADQLPHGVAGEPAALPPGPGPAVQPAAISSPKMELKARKADTGTQAAKPARLQYGGILLQLFRNNPLHLINPLAPASYGNGDANTTYNIITGQADGLTVLAIKF
jgi:hypothetical protein